MIMDIQKHPLIPRHAFVTLRNNFNAIDNVLSLHYTNHTSNPLLNKILTQASSLTQTKITVTHIEQIMEITDSLYEIYRLDEELVIKFSSTTQLSRRREVFIKNINKWIETHQELNTIPPKKSSYTTEATFELCSSSLPSSPVSFLKTSPNKIIKPRSANSSPTKIKNRSLNFSDLKNDSSRFKFKEKLESIESNKFNGLSLLERIKLKEKLRKQQEQDEISKQQTPQDKYQNYLLTKIPMIYNAIYQLYQCQPNNCKTFSTKKLIQTIQDSSSYPVIPDEIHDGMKLLSTKLPSKLDMIEKNDIKVIRVTNLNRDQDLKTLDI